VRLIDEHGVVAVAPVAGAAEQAVETLQAAVPPLTPGIWRVEWQVFSTDGHVVSGSYGFRLAP
jgi:methionine-rich copper-binding protein CopC